MDTEKLIEYMEQRSDNVQQMTLNEIMALMKEVQQLRDAYKEKKEELDRIKKIIIKYESDLLPGIFLENGLTALNMPDGKALKMKTDYFPSTAKERFDDIKTFLRMNDGEYLLEPELKVKVSGDEELNAVSDTLASIGTNHTLDYKINTNSLKAYLKRLMENPEIEQDVKDLANNLFKLNIVHKVTLV